MGSVKVAIAPQSGLFSSVFYDFIFFATCFKLCSHLVSQRNSKWNIWMAHALPKPGQSCLYRDVSTFGICSNSKTCQIILSFFFVPSLSLCASHPHRLSPSLSLVVNGDVKYLNTLCCAGTMHSSRWTGPARDGCMQISIQSSPGCFQSNTSASGPVLIPLYPQPARFFIKSNAVSAVSTWTSGPTTKPEGERDRRASVGERIWLAWNIRRWVWDMERLGEMSKGLCGIVLELLNKSSLTLLLLSDASVEIRAWEAYACLGGQHVAEALALCFPFPHCFLSSFFFPCCFLCHFQRQWVMLGAVVFDWLLFDVTNEAGSSQTPGNTWHPSAERAHHHTGIHMDTPYSITGTIKTSNRWCVKNSHFRVTTPSNWWTDTPAG